MLGRNGMFCGGGGHLRAAAATVDRFPKNIPFVSGNFSLSVARWPRWRRCGYDSADARLITWRSQMTRNTSNRITKRGGRRRPGTSVVVMATIAANNVWRSLNVFGIMPLILNTHLWRYYDLALTGGGGTLAVSPLSLKISICCHCSSSALGNRVHDCNLPCKIIRLHMYLDYTFKSCKNARLAQSLRSILSGSRGRGLQSPTDVGHERPSGCCVKTQTRYTSVTSKLANAIFWRFTRH